MSKDLEDSTEKLLGSQRKGSQLNAAKESKDRTSSKDPRSKTLKPISTSVVNHSSPSKPRYLLTWLFIDMVWNISPPWWVTWHESSTKKWFEVQKPENLIQMIKSQRKVKKDHTEWDKPKPKIGPQRHGQRLYATDQQSMTPQERGRAQHSHAMAKHRFLQKEAKAQHNRCESMQKLKLPQNA